MVLQKKNVLRMKKFENVCGLMNYQNYFLLLELADEFVKSAKHKQVLHRIFFVLLLWSAPHLLKTQILLS